MRHPDIVGIGGEPQVRYGRLGELLPQKENRVGRLKRHYDEVVQPTWNFSGRIKTEEGHQQNALVGLASESGESLDIGKKMWFHTEKPFEHWREKLLSELGDVLYYWLKAVHLFGFTVEGVLDYNRKKLASRHPELGEVFVRFGKDAIK